MRILFSILSLLYIAAIFILAGSPAVDTLSEFNPYSLIHIPLYGILAGLLVFSMVPITREFGEASIQSGSNSRELPSKETIGLKLRFFIAGAIGLAVAALDEIHQLYVPGRDGSAMDVVLDLAGITLALLLCSRLLKSRLARQTG
jgi:hypothetical protein